MSTEKNKKNKQQETSENKEQEERLRNNLRTALSSLEQTNAEIEKIQQKLQALRKQLPDIED